MLAKSKVVRATVRFVSYNVYKYTCHIQVYCSNCSC